MKQDDNYPHRCIVLQKLVCTPLTKNMAKLKVKGKKEKYTFHHPYEILLVYAMWPNSIIPTKLGCLGRYET